ncbi:MAG: TraR/DksA C4-type zinc finger protein [Armatimonadota bacterium]
MAQTLDLERMKQLLLDERARLELELNRVGVGTRRSQADEMGELTTYDDHQADLGTSTFERAKDLSVHEALSNLMKQVDAALLRIEKGIYGICDMCGSPISRERLEAIPYASLCIACQETLEG